MGATGGRLLELAGDAEVDPRTQQALVSMAKSVASATAALVTNARNVAAKCDDQALQNQVILSAKQTALATQGLIACTKVRSKYSWGSAIFSQFVVYYNYSWLLLALQVKVGKVASFVSKIFVLQCSTTNILPHENYLLHMV